jgi:hypothetical protein
MQATPEWSTWSAIAKASAKVVFSFVTRNRFWFGMTISVSTLFRKRECEQQPVDLHPSPAPECR